MGTLLVLVATTYAASTQPRPSEAMVVGRLMAHQRPSSLLPEMAITVPASILPSDDEPVLGRLYTRIVSSARAAGLPAPEAEGRTSRGTDGRLLSRITRTFETFCVRTKSRFTQPKPSLVNQVGSLICHHSPSSLRASTSAEAPTEVTPRIGNVSFGPVRTVAGCCVVNCGAPGAGWST